MDFDEAGPARRPRNRLLPPTVLPRGDGRLLHATSTKVDREWGGSFWEHSLRQAHQNQPAGSQRFTSPIRHCATSLEGLAGKTSYPMGPGHG